MRIDALNAYTNPNVLKADDTNLKKLSQDKTLKKTNAKDGNQINLELKNPNKLITDSERKFFIKIFPENSQQLENHVVFNRNGRINSMAFTKGTVVDGRI